MKDHDYLFDLARKLRETADEIEEVINEDKENSIEASYSPAKWNDDGEPK